MIKKFGGLCSTARLRNGKCERFPGGNDWSLERTSTQAWTTTFTCAGTEIHMEKHILERDKDPKLFYLEIDRLILYQPGVLLTLGGANAVGMAKHTIKEAVKGNMIDYDALSG